MWLLPESSSSPLSPPHFAPTALIAARWLAELPVDSADTPTSA